MRVPFIKMHGLGNDFIVIDARDAAVPALTEQQIRGLADRRTGIGCDQLILLTRDDIAHVRMEIRNADGSVAEACGNASRAVAALLGGEARIATAGGVIAANVRGADVSVDMGVPRFGWNEIPLAYPLDTAHLPLAYDELEDPVAVNIGNPHLVFFVAALDRIPLAELGPRIETDPLFPQRINVNVAEVTGPRSVTLRVWERGAGLTRACGTGACATAVAAINRQLVASPVTVQLPGGTLEIAWDGRSGVVMTGPAREAFRGTFDPADFA